MMFIDASIKKMHTSPNPERAKKFAATQYATAAEGIRKAAPNWGNIQAPTSAVRDRVWEMFYEYARRAVKLMLFHGDAALTNSEEFQSVVSEIVSVLYPHENYLAEILDRLHFIAEQALSAAKPSARDRYSPLDALQCFRRALSAHLGMHEELDRKLKRYVGKYASAIRNELRAAEFEQSKYDGWESRYLYCERRYQQIVNRIGEIERPSAPTICNPRSAWELRAQVKDWAELHLSPIQTSTMEYSWRFCQQLRNAVNRDRADAAQHLDLNYKNRRGIR